MRRWDDSAKMRQCGVSKTRGCSWIDVGARAHEFHAGGSLHHHSENIYQLLNEAMKREGKEDAAEGKPSVLTGGFLSGCEVRRWGEEKQLCFGVMHLREKSRRLVCGAVGSDQEWSVRVAGLRGEELWEKK
uniref:Uncharacterized protein n=1 Tax=Populus alba TaxID=43335 RepID=A0A4U5MXS2_POPAL|nr:hypothetical protein D5086_0000291000 [Populus alba]